MLIEFTQLRLGWEMIDTNPISLTLETSLFPDLFLTDLKGHLSL